MISFKEFNEKLDYWFPLLLLLVLALFACVLVGGVVAGGAALIATNTDPNGGLIEFMQSSPAGWIDLHFIGEFIKDLL